MDQKALQQAEDIVRKTYLAQGHAGLNARRKLIKSLLSQRRLPELGWDELSINMLLQEASLMDSNNFLGNIGVGEREARVACPLVSRRHFGMAHGVGRSGDIGAVQPKAAGSSLLAKLTNKLAQHALKIAGLEDISNATVLPLATGMALTSTLLALKRTLPDTARYVLWPRVDQKTCIKCITAAGLEVSVIENVLVGDQLCTNLELMRNKILELGKANIVAVLSTTSCFAPRAGDDVVQIAKLCQELEIGHVINNAYGVQAKALCKQISQAWRRGKVDAVIQSTDKNFMVPVGGCIIAAGPNQSDFINKINSAYPGRASSSPMLDLLITFLHWGVSGWKKVLQDREDLYNYAHQELQCLEDQNGCRLLQTPGNPISLALKLDHLTLSRPVDQSKSESTDHAKTRDITFLGSMLFQRGVSGTRVIGRGKDTTVEGIKFSGYGGHCDFYPHDYLTVAAAVGTQPQDIDEFIMRLSSCIRTFVK